MKKLYLIICVLTLSNCLAQENESIKKNITPETNFDVLLLKGTSDFPKGAVQVSNGFVIVGINYTKTDSINHLVSLIKIDNAGKVIKSVDLGEESSPGRKSSGLVSIFKLNNKIVLFGAKGNDLWVREVDENLNVLNDLVYDSISIDRASPIKLKKINKNRFVLVHNSEYYANPGIEVTVFDSSLNLINRLQINNDLESFNYSEFMMQDVDFDTAKNLLYIGGSGCIKGEDGSCKEYYNMIIELNPTERDIKSIINLPKDNFVMALQLVRDTFFVASWVDSLDKVNQKSTQNATAFAFDKKGEKLMEMVFDESNHDRPHDILVAENKIHMIGNTLVYDSTKSSSYGLIPTAVSFHLIYDKKGELIEKNIYKDSNTYQNRALKIYETSSNKKLIIGKGNGWRIILKD